MARTQRRIETQQAKALRSRRQHLAAPGGPLDAAVRIMGKALPIGVGAILALMIVWPLSPRGEISFLLDRNKVAVINERLALDNALYRGEDNKGRPFSVSAGDAVQRSSKEGIVRVRDLVARVLLTGGPARITAPAGQYDIADDTIRIDGTMQVLAPDGYDLIASGVSVDLADKTVVGSGGVSGSVPSGTFRANRLDADLDARTVTLTGDARLRMVPGKLRMPGL